MKIKPKLITIAAYNSTTSVSTTSLLEAKKLMSGPTRVKITWENGTKTIMRTTPEQFETELKAALAPDQFDTSMRTDPLPDLTDQIVVYRVGDSAQLGVVTGQKEGRYIIGPSYITLHPDEFRLLGGL